jgi:hypothetical protein
MLFAWYLPVERLAHLPDRGEKGEDVQTIDADGVGAVFAHYVKDNDPQSLASLGVDTCKTWFNATWDLLAVPGE